MSHDYRELLRPFFAGRRFLLIGGVVNQLAALAAELAALGAERPFLLGSAVGLGTPPDASELPWHALDRGGEDMIRSMWRYETALADLPEDARGALDAWDPERRALATGYIVLGDVPEVGGRGRYAARPPEWLELEDKTRFHELLDAAGVRRGPVAVTSARAGYLRGAHARLDRGAGTVWAGDCTPGVHGGGSFVRWVRDESGAEEACAMFSSACRRVRVMPFVEGLPCSIHGLVFPDYVAVFRPVELITLRRPGAGFVYAGTATFWDPPDAAREQLRELARRVGAELRERVGFRGVFTLDGVLGADGFVPTEVNPRIGAGFFHMAEALPELPLGPLALAVAAGESADWRPRELEARVLEAADQRRSGSGRLFLPARAGLPEATRPLRCEGPGYRPVRGEESPDAWLSLGPLGAGSFLFFAPRRASLRLGAPLAPQVGRAFAAADQLFDTRIGTLLPAEVVA